MPKIQMLYLQFINIHGGFVKCSFSMVIIHWACRKFPVGISFLFHEYRHWKHCKLFLWSILITNPGLHEYRHWKHCKLFLWSFYILYNFVFYPFISLFVVSYIYSSVLALRMKQLSLHVVSKEWMDALKDSCRST